MSNKRCYIVCAGECFGLPFKPKDGDTVIAADAGFGYLKDVGIVPDTVIGDFDSLGYIPEGENIIKLNTCKDETDTFSAAQYGLSKGFNEFHIWCATGGRTDHTFANIQLLSYLASKGAQGFIYDKESVLTVIKDGEYTFDKELSGYISVLSLTDESTGVDIKNLKYELDGGTLTNTFPVGTSNEFIGKSGKIRVKKGMILIIFPRKV